MGLLIYFIGCLGCFLFMLGVVVVEQKKILVEDVLLCGGLAIFSWLGLIIVLYIGFKSNGFGQRVIWEEKKTEEKGKNNVDNNA